MIDVHCHLNFHTFEKDVDKVIESAFDTGVRKIINVGTKLDSSIKAVTLAKEYENLFAIVGIHPHHADKLLYCHPEPSEGHRFFADAQNDTPWIERLEKLARKPKVVAIGEIGLDYYRYRSNDIVQPKLQKEIFIKQIELAHKLKLPLQVHNRHAGKDILDIILNHKSYLLNPPGMFHCMSGGIDLLKKVLNLGFYVGFDGNITYEGIAKGETTDLKELVRHTPLDRIVAETDSPFLTPEPHRGSRNVPEHVIIVAKALAKIKGVSFDKINHQTTKNANVIFRLNKS